MINNLRLWSEKLEALVATGMPGLYKIIIFYFLAKFHSVDILGEVSTWQSIAQILGYFTAIGWASLIVVRVAKASGSKDQVDEFAKLAQMSVSSLLIVGLFVGLLGAVSGKFAAALEILLWLAAWTFYQVVRHFRIARKEYRSLIILDMCIIIASIVAVGAIQSNSASFVLAMIMLIGAVIAIYCIANFKPFYISSSFEKKGVEFGFVNFLGGGVSLTLIPLANFLEGASTAGFISLFLSFSSVVILIPRALSMNQLPNLSRAIVDHSAARKMVKLVKRRMLAVNLLASSVCGVAAVYFFWMSSSVTLTIIIAIFSILLQNAFIIQGMIDANVLMAKEKSEVLLKINGISFIAYLLSVIPLVLFSGDRAFILICITMTLATIYRSLSNRWNSAKVLF